MTFRASNPLSGALLEPAFADATLDAIDAACGRAADAAAAYAAHSAASRAGFLRAIAGAIEALGSSLLERAHAETGLPLARLEGERGRTAAQLRLFADVVDDGGWVEARIDPALPERKPPRPDLRRMLHPLGPVAVFGASNFPLAFSVAGGDTAAALAAGCPVVVKAHPAHPGTSELVAGAIATAVRDCGMPAGVFAMVHGLAAAVGAALVEHPAIQAVAFTGSLRGGRALFDLAARRPNPIPFFGELGSANPVVILPQALAARGDEIARGLAAAVTLGSGQFCTNPGLAFVAANATAGQFVTRLGELLSAAPAGTMVHGGIKSAFDAAVTEVAALDGVTLAAQGAETADPGNAAARSSLFVADGATYLRHERLAEEIYGPATVAVTCAGREQLLAIARSLPGHLTATLHADGTDLSDHADLVAVLRTKVGRLVVNGFPTGVEVSHAMQHGGPYPAATEPRSTSVGTAAIGRFARPVCYQGFPDEALPDELRRANPRGIVRMVDGRLTTEPA